MFVPSWVGIIPAGPAGGVAGGPAGGMAGGPAGGTAGGPVGGMAGGPAGSMAGGGANAGGNSHGGCRCRAYCGYGREGIIDSHCSSLFEVFLVYIKLV